MRRNFFGEVIFQPGDEPDTIRDYLGDEPFSVDIFGFEDHMGWNGEVRDAEGTGISLADFESRDQLVTWAKRLGVPDTDITDVD